LRIGPDRDRLPGTGRLWIPPFGKGSLYAARLEVAAPSSDILDLTGILRTSCRRQPIIMAPQSSSSPNVLESLSAVDRRTALKQISLAVLTASLLGQPRRAGAAESLRALADGKLPDDQRLGELKDLDGYFPFQPSASAAEWEQRSAYVRRQILVASGLWPFPAHGPLKPVIHGRVERDDYSVEKVYFESAPGLYVTGNLYRPKAQNGLAPAILCPHGHWANGRFFAHSEQAVQKELELGAEEHPICGRYPLQARCVQLARMGCLVFHYDMLGYADNAPLTQEVTHGLRTQRADLTSPERWGLFSAQSELRLINALGLQTYNSLRALDWISGMPEVDAERIGVTGASGGGTQTFMLAAIDQRPAAAFPAVMVSTAMQGGCTCENAVYLRIDTGNIEFAAMCAPRPVGMSAANDWTRELETKGLPELKQHYAMLGVPDRVEGKYFNFDHNYNYVSRRMMYEFFNRHLELKQSSPITEREFKPLTVAEMSVWNEEHPKPAMDVEAELRMLRAWDESSRQQIEALRPKDYDSLATYRAMIGSAVDIMIGRRLPKAGDVELELTSKVPLAGYMRFLGLLRNKSKHEELPALFLQPENWNGTAVIWVDGDGKAPLLNADGTPSAIAQILLKGGAAIGAVDVLYTGEFLTGGEAHTRSRTVSNPREIAAYTQGYNHPLFSQRTHDLLTLITFVRNHERTPRRVCLAGVNGGAAWAAAACVQAGAAVDRLGVATGGFRFANITDIRDPQLLPGAVKYGDLPGLLSLAAPHPLWLAGEGAAVPEIIAACYKAAGAASVVTLDQGPDESAVERLARWLLT
jgi:dienelactone hydrolase